MERAWHTLRIFRSRMPWRLIVLFALAVPGAFPVPVLAQSVPPDVPRSVRYGYDASGRRVFEEVRTPLGTTVTRSPTPEYQEITHPDGTVERIVSIEVAGMPIATVRTVGTGTSEVYYPHTDHLRSTRLVTNQTGGVVEKTDYDSFGKITNHAQTGTFAERKKFTSHEFDAATNYTYAKARYLDTEMGRFISQEPLVWQAPEGFLVDPQLFNTYAYARNNPIKFVDPTGKLIEYFGRSIPQTAWLGTHTAWNFAPQSPNDVNLTALGIPQGTTQFTIGFYPKDGKLVLETAYEGKEGVSKGALKDFRVATGEARDQGRVSVDIPSGYESEADFINSFGEIAAGYGNDVDYDVRNRNSNTGGNTLGYAAGVGNQIGRFNPVGWNPGINSLLSPSSFNSVQSQIAVIQAHIASLQEQISALQAQSANSTTPWLP